MARDGGIPGTGREAAGDELTKPERRLRFWLRVSAFGNGSETLLYLLPAVIGPVKAWGLLPFVVGSTVKSTLLAGTSWVAAADVRRFSSVVAIVILAYTVWALAALVVLVEGDVGASYTILGLDVTIRAILWGGFALEGALAVFYAWLWHRALRARWKLRYLWPHQFATASALGESLLPSPHRLLRGDEIATRVDGYLSGFEARRKSPFQFALTGIYLYPLATLRPPFPLMSVSERARFVEKRFMRDVEEARIPRIVRPILRPILERVQEAVQGGIRLGQQMVYLGYYSDPRTFDSVGYVPFSARQRYPKAMRRVRRERPGLIAGPPTAADGDRIEADAVVIGSGAAGATIAYRLAEAGRRVTILERGRHVDPRCFTEDEVDMISRLYEDGALQLSRDFRFQVLQGMCVGGSTVVNNGVCFELPDRVLDHWNADLGAGISRQGLTDAFATLRRRLPIARQSDAQLNPGARKFVDGARELGLAKRGFGIVEANIADCLGCGYCNIGCAFGKKLSMLDTVLPKGQAQFGTEGLRILSECRADGIAHDGRVATGVACRTRDGRKLTVRAKTIVVSGGAVNSSYLLLRSGIGGARVGQDLCFNMGSPITADFEDTLNSYDGLQISHYLEGEPEGAFVLETWWNPVVSQALTMPGWLSDHWRNMRRYANMTATGVLVGTERSPKARVRKGRGGPLIDFEPTGEDLSRLAKGLKLAASIYLAAPGVTRVMPATWRFREYRTEGDLCDLDACVAEPGELVLGTGHPQGGNALNPDPEKGVVDPDFRVHGMDNLYVCDASVFPSATTVNPQMTVMAIAEYAAPRIAPTP